MKVFIISFVLLIIIIINYRSKSVKELRAPKKTFFFYLLLAPEFLNHYLIILFENLLHDLNIIDEDDGISESLSDSDSTSPSFSPVRIEKEDPLDEIIASDALPDNEHFKAILAEVKNTILIIRNDIRNFNIAEEDFEKSLFLRVQRREKLVPIRKNVRKRKLNVELHIDTKAKKARMSGIAGVGRNGKLILPRGVKVGCNKKCRLKCKTKMTAEDREYANRIYWNLYEHKKKWECLMHWTKKTDNITIFHLPLQQEGQFVRVCLKMFLDTLSKIFFSSFFFFFILYRLQLKIIIVHIISINISNYL